MASDPEPAVAGTKRPHDALDDAPQKRRRVRRGALRHVQQRPTDIELAPQDPVFVQGQILKSISAALVMAGYDSVKPSALEMFRAQVEEYMLQFLKQARTSMHANRRTRPTALDFASALAQTPITHTASLLEPQLDLELPEDISYPSIPEPDHAPPQAPDFSTLLQPLIEQKPPTWIPNHFPALPPQHAWKQTPVFPAREKDARQMRKKATEEGMLAEQALRKLAAAAKTSAMHAEKRRSSVLSGEGRAREPARSHKQGTKVHEDTFGDVLREVGGVEDAMELDGATNVRDGMDQGMPEGVMVNHDLVHWRRQQRGLRA
ncbi:uncharacterized protein MYCFIDRAFT_211209 [Pseudocercospora fijiensis CIRAD86]|uniref:Transcription initiation factor TFIID subunit 8 n=1 Tax=Pseudocercospora fijiensis (strain CIRAD86) TaxID=383855 RepID=M3B0M2_PSEFD|nr:uncharacterized protein MYCFIDRAFT_211209 [Pseudocercospora fijiensis CIRAD86]EME82958.1 hypothetical protein MYCFIDRAFT_211209 [Pseudocercospora fijiensis CIRAD86]